MTTHSGNIFIKRGTITAKSGSGAGIGSGERSGGGGTIKVDIGKVTIPAYARKY